MPRASGDAVNSWPHRVIQRHGKFAVHRVYYDEQGNIWTCSEEPVYPEGELLENLGHDVQLYRAALYSQISTIIRKRLEIQDKLGNSYRILGMINWRIGNTYECRGYWHLARQCYASRPSDLAIIDQYDGYIYYRIGDTDRGYRVRKQIPG